MSKGMVFMSRFTSGLENGEDVAFQIGDKVTYQRLDGTLETCVILTKLMTKMHEGILRYGYEATFPDGERAFADEKRIVGWDGKC